MSWDTALGALIALAGVFLADWNARRREREQRDHEDRTRFHAERLTAYSAFHKGIFAVLSVVKMPTPQSTALQVSLNQRFLEAVSSFSDAHSAISLLSTEASVKKADEVFRLIHPLTKEFGEAWTPEKDKSVDEAIRKGVEWKQLLRADLAGKVSTS